MLTPRNNLLTPEGWKNITDLRPGNEILTVNFAGHGIFSPIINIIEYDYDGYIYEHTHVGLSKTTHFSVTAGSIVTTLRRHSSKSPLTGKRRMTSSIQTEPVEDLLAYKGPIRPFHASQMVYNTDSKFHSAGIIKNGAVNMTDVDYYRFLAYVIFRTSIKQNNGLSKKALEPHIRIRKYDNPVYLFELLDKYSIPYRLRIVERNNRPDVGTYVVPRSGASAARSIRRIIQRKKPHERVIPDTIMRSTSPDAITAFLVETLRLFKPKLDLREGKLPESRLRIIIPNRKLADQLSELLYKVGRSTTVKEDKVRNGETTKPVFYLFINKGIRIHIYPQDIIKKRYKGKAYVIHSVNDMAVCNPSSLNSDFAMVTKIN